MRFEGKTLRFKLRFMDERWNKLDSYWHVFKTDKMIQRAGRRILVSEHKWGQWPDARAKEEKVALVSFIRYPQSFEKKSSWKVTW